MQIETITAEKHTILKLSGRLDVTWAEHVLNSALELLRGGQHALWIDAAGLEYLSSAGIRVLIRMRREVTAVQGSFAIINPSPFVENTLRMSGLEALLEAPQNVPGASCSGQAVQKSPKLEAPATGDVHGASCSGLTVQAQEPPELEAPATGEVAGMQVDVHTIAAGAGLHVQAPATWQPWHPVQDADIVNIPLPSTQFALGIGAPGVDAADSRSRFGEFAAISGCLSWVPAGGGGTPDYLVHTEQFVPSVFAIQALVAEGAFSHLLRFRPKDKTGMLPLSVLIEQGLQATASDAIAMVCMAEIEGLVGVALSRSPGLITPADLPGNFPQIRDWVAFCGERVHTRHAALLVSFAARHPEPGLAPYLTPLPSQPGLFAHTHAVVLPFRPLPEGSIDLEEQVRMFYDNMEPLDLLHLIEDNRPAVGLGQSAFLRGACWCAPFTFGKEGNA